MVGGVRVLPAAELGHGSSVEFADGPENDGDGGLEVGVDAEDDDRR